MGSLAVDVDNKEIAREANDHRNTRVRPLFKKPLAEFCFRWKSPPEWSPFDECLLGFGNDRDDRQP